MKFIEVSKIETTYMVFKEIVNLIILTLLLIWYALSATNTFTLPFVMFLISFYKTYKVTKLHDARLSYGNSLKDSKFYFQTGQDFNQIVTMHSLKRFSDEDYALHHLGKINILLSMISLYSFFYT